MPDSPVAVVTGAYRGLGRETCRQLAHLGFRVILTARREAEGRAAAETRPSDQSSSSSTTCPRRTSASTVASGKRPSARTTLG